MITGAAKSKGFTIVELLIVIVVIAILAAITLVTYSGIQQRSKNTAIIAAATQTYKVINAYITANSSYPITSNVSPCLSSTSGCIVNNVTISSNTTLDNNLQTMGTFPKSIPMNGGNQTGILFSYNSARTFNGAAQPGLLFYWLYGTSQQCGLPDIVTGWLSSSSSTTGYTTADDSSTGKTLCYVHINGPGS